MCTSSTHVVVFRLLWVALWLKLAKKVREHGSFVVLARGQMPSDLGENGTSGLRLNRVVGGAMMYPLISRHRPQFLNSLVCMYVRYHLFVFLFSGWGLGERASMLKNRDVF